MLNLKEFLSDNRGQSSDVFKLVAAVIIAGIIFGIIVVGIGQFLNPHNPQNNTGYDQVDRNTGLLLNESENVSNEIENYSG